MLLRIFRLIQQSNRFEICWFGRGRTLKGYLTYRFPIISYPGDAGMRSEHCPQCGAHQVFRRIDQQEVLWALLSPTMLTTKALPSVELYACACCGHFACYGDGQGLFNNALVAPESPPVEQCEQVKRRRDGQRHVPTPHELSLQECRKCGTRVRRTEICKICGKTAADENK